MKISKRLRRFGKKLRNIALGWFYLAVLFDPPYAKARRKICRGCTSNKFNVCTECGCPLLVKPRVKEEVCDLGKW